MEKEGSSSSYFAPVFWLKYFLKNKYVLLNYYSLCCGKSPESKKNNKIGESGDSE